MNTTPTTNNSQTARNLALVAALVLVSLCLLLGLFLATAPLWGPAVGLQNELWVCAGYTAVGRFQMGVNWTMIWMSSLPPVIFDQQVCTYMPRVPGWSPQGAIAFPP